MIIEVDSLKKSFKVARRNAGMKEAFSSFFHPRYTTVNALEDVTFSIKSGEIVGYIGPNGAGKSTTIKIISGVLVPDSGKCSVLGFTPWKDRVNYVKNIGVVFGQRTQLWWDVPVIDSFHLLKDIYAIDTQTFKSNVSLLTDTLDLSLLLQTPVRQLRLGQRMRCEIAASLLHNPKILFLDEPTIGLDAASKIAVRKFVKTINREKNVTVILTTHDMSDIEALTNRIILIGKGKTLLDGTLAQLKTRFNEKKIITVDFVETNVEVNVPDTEIVSRTNKTMKLSIDTEKVRASEVIGLLANQLDIIDVSVENRPIEEIILSLYNKFEI